jgi:DNA-binding NtrC family response regulator
MNRSHFLLLDATPSAALGDALADLLGPHAASCRRVAAGSAAASRDAEAVAEAVARDGPDLIFLVLPCDPLEPAAALLKAVAKAAPHAPVVAVVGGGEPAEMLGLLRLGADDFITAPLRAGDLLPRVWRLVERSRREQTLADVLKQKLGLSHLVGESESFLAEVRKIPLVARCDASVLISGETGTGKELCARAVHYLSPRASGPFVPVNCGAIPLELVENELFGHERGAFTGAATAERGLIQEVEGGTLFLDEVDCLPLLAQVKLLRLLQEKEFRPLGSARTRKADVRVIAATNSDVEQSVRDGRLRRDLYFRLNIIPLRLPPLRDRREDISPLARHFLEKYAAEFGKRLVGFSPAAARALAAYDWPGNVRELEHVVERAVVFSERQTVGVEDVELPDAGAGAGPEPFQQMKNRVVEQFEKAYIQELLAANHGNITRAAEAARKNRRAFWQLIRKHHIDVKAFKAHAS